MTDQTTQETTTQPTPTVEGSGRTERELKVWPQYADGLESGAKTFEFRKDDRNPRYAAGDVLRLREFVPEPCREFDAETNTCRWGNLCKGEDGHYTGREWRRRVTYVARGGVIPEGYCCMAIEPVPSPTAARGVTGLPTWEEESWDEMFRDLLAAIEEEILPEDVGDPVYSAAVIKKWDAIKERARTLLSAAEQGERDREDVVWALRTWRGARLAELMWDYQSSTERPDAQQVEDATQDAVGALDELFARLTGEDASFWPPRQPRQEGDR